MGYPSPLSLLTTITLHTTDTRPPASLLRSAVGGGGFGEPWQRGSYLQLAGLSVMLMGTAVYNGSISLPCLPKGEWLLSPSGSRTSHMASPVLTRSPLVTGGASLSPVAPPRPMLPVNDPMASRGDGPNLRDKLLPGRK
jgi:hypothetical protein